MTIELAGFVVVCFCRTHSLVIHFFPPSWSNKRYRKKMIEGTFLPAAPSTSSNHGSLTHEFLHQASKKWFGAEIKDPQFPGNQQRHALVCGNSMLPWDHMKIAFSVNKWYLHTARLWLLMIFLIYYFIVYIHFTMRQSWEKFLHKTPVWIFSFERNYKHFMLMEKKIFGTVGCFWLWQ